MLSIAPGQHEIRIHSDRVNKALYEFSGLHKSWPLWGADKVEVVMQHRGGLPVNAHFVGFDEKTDEVIFRVPYGETPQPRVVELRQVWNRRETELQEQIIALRLAGDETVKKLLKRIKSLNKRIRTLRNK